MTDRRRSPSSGADGAGWVLETGGTVDHAVQASLLALCDGAVGVRGGLEDYPEDDHFVLVSGAFGSSSDGLVRPLPGAGWTIVDGADRPTEGSRARRRLDLRSGELTRIPPDGGLRTMRFLSLTRPGTMVLTAEDDRVASPWPDALARPHVASGPTASYEWCLGQDDDVFWVETVSDRATVTTVAQQTHTSDGGRRKLERVAVVRSGRASQRSEAEAALADARALGVEGLLDEHRAAWAERWSAADIEIEGDPASQLAIRFALFHLLSCAPTSGSAGVGARGLTGLAYAGHVFWDTDVFVLPTLAATIPDAARSLLSYRVDRAEAARLAAATQGLPGARYPWESADEGVDVTPTSTRDLDGRIVPIRTGERAEHINADLAWAARHFMQWTGEERPLDGAVLGMVLETARYWRARIRTDGRGHGHLYGVIGPDEYHEVVDDNAYTNVMVRWHLRWAASIAREMGAEAEAIELEVAADTLVDGFDASTGRHEQFAGFFELEPLLIRDLANPPVAADILLGRSRIFRTQVVKQPDVLMLHHLQPDACPAGSLRADLNFYLPRTAHGSSLSPAICAALLARDGRPDEAIALFDLAARLDLDDLTGTTAGGLHLATMGGLWQAVVAGFLGIRPTDAGLVVDPRLPTRWSRCSVRLRYRDVPIRVVVDHDTVGVEAESPVRCVIAGAPMVAPLCVAIPEPEERS